MTNESIVCFALAYSNFKKTLHLTMHGLPQPTTFEFRPGLANRVCYGGKPGRFGSLALVPLEPLFLRVLRLIGQRCCCAMKWVLRSATALLLLQPLHWR
jgi:hypothetical protein